MVREFKSETSFSPHASARGWILVGRPFFPCLHRVGLVHIDLSGAIAVLDSFIVQSE